MVKGITLNGTSIRASSLTPCQVRAKRSVRIATDYYVAPMLKHPGISEFHSRAALYHATLLEGYPAVQHYVPRPFTLWMRGKPYVPTCYVARGSASEVIELTANGTFDERRREALVAFFKPQRMAFAVFSHESVLKRALEAQNWLRVVKTLLRHSTLETDTVEFDLLTQLTDAGPTCLGKFLVPQDRQSSLVQEVALLRLLHRGAMRLRNPSSVV